MDTINRFAEQTYLIEGGIFYFVVANSILWGGYALGFLNSMPFTCANSGLVAP